MPEQQGTPPARARVAPRSRRDALLTHSIEPDMPPLEWGRHLIECLFEIGPTMAAGMGAAPLAPSEIEAAQRLLGVQFHPWEARLLLRLSREYLGESHRATEHGCAPPWDDEVVRNIDMAETARRMEQDMIEQMQD